MPSAWIKTSWRSTVFFLSILLSGVSQCIAQDSFSDHNSSLPVEIESDDLEVRQAESTAIFSGNVDALQGAIALKADRLVVFYQLSGEDTANSQPIERIEAEGNVVITSPTETASGDVGVYDLIAATMELTGNVVLTRGDNIIEGSKLNIDLANDIATVRAENQGDGRVKALFQPGSASTSEN